MAQITEVKMLIVEGPAGSGKSTAIHALVDQYPHYFRRTYPITPIQRPRDYGDDDRNGANLSLVKDYVHFMSVLAQWRYSHNQIYVLDRFIWSQYVYGSMRLGHYRPMDIRRGVTVGFDALNDVADDYLARSNVESIGSWETRWVPSLKPLTLFYIPPVEVIEARRKTANRKFIWPASQEHAQYNRIIRDCVQNWGFSWMKTEKEFPLPEILTFFNIHPEEGELI